MKPARKVIPFRIPAQARSRKNITKKCWYLAMIDCGEWTRLSSEFSASAKRARADLRLLSRSALGKNPALVHLKKSSAPFPSECVVAVSRSVVRGLQDRRKVYVMRAPASLVEEC